MAAKTTFTENVEVSEKLKVHLENMREKFHSTPEVLALINMAERAMQQRNMTELHVSAQEIFEKQDTELLLVLRGVLK